MDTAFIEGIIAGGGPARHPGGRPGDCLFDFGGADSWVLLYVFYFSRPESPIPASSTAVSSVCRAEYARLRRRYRFRFLGLAAVAGLMIFGTALIMQPQGIEMGAFIPLLVASVYIGVGLWGAGSRYVVIGATLAVLALCGYLMLRDHFLLLMAFAGGGALILTGLWLRNA